MEHIKCTKKYTRKNNCQENLKSWDVVIDTEWNPFYIKPFYPRSFKEFCGCSNHNFKREGIKANILNLIPVDIASQWYNVGGQSVVHRSAAYTSPGILLEMQNLGLIPNLLNQNPNFNKMHIKVWEALIDDLTGPTPREWANSYHPPMEIPPLSYLSTVNQILWCHLP